jgi:hypothetical protein
VPEISEADESHLLRYNQRHRQFFFSDRAAARSQSMPFIEMTGTILERIVAEDELHHGDLATAGVAPGTIVRVNRQGDIEVRRPEGWDVIGGLLGDFDERVRRETGLNWA